MPQTTVRHKLTVLAWNHFFLKASKDSINLTEIRSPARLERELGFYESTSLRACLESLHDVLKIGMDSSGGPSEDAKGKFYDDISFNLMGSPCPSHLLDHIANVKPGNDHVISIQYQFITVSLMIWSFGLDDIKPLSLFSNQESSLFFQGGGSNTSSGGSALSFFSGGAAHSRGVTNHRRRFIELSSDNAVATICCSQEEDGRGLDMAAYNQWSSKIVLLSKMWNMVEKVREIQTVALFKGGHDELGVELMNNLPDKKFVAHRLLRLALMRLSRYIYLDSANTAVMGRAAIVMSPEMTRHLESLKTEAAHLNASISLKTTADLLVLLTTIDSLEEANHQLAFECLAITRNFQQKS